MDNFPQEQTGCKYPWPRPVVKSPPLDPLTHTIPNCPSIILSIVYCFASSVDVDLPNELYKADTVELLTSNDIKEAPIKLKDRGKWVMTADQIKKILPSIKWIIFDIGKEKMRHVLQVENSSAIIHCDKLSIEYTFHIPLSLMLKKGLDPSSIETAPK